MAAAQASDDGVWKYEFTPYVWAAGLDGTIRIKDKPSAGLAVDQSFSDVLKKLDFGLMGAFEARHDRWALLLDGVYFRVSDKGGLSGPLGFTSLEGKATVTQQLYALAGAYRVHEGPQVVDVIGGLRYNSVKWDVNVTATVPVIPVASSRFAQTKHLGGSLHRRSHPATPGGSLVPHGLCRYRRLRRRFGPELASRGRRKLCIQAQHDWEVRLSPCLQRL